MKKFFVPNNSHPIEVASWDDVVNYCCEKYSVEPFQVSNKRYTTDIEFGEIIYYVDITTKIGEVFATAGVTNFK